MDKSVRTGKIGRAGKGFFSPRIVAFEPEA
jgi:hypothetical protein